MCPEMQVLKHWDGEQEFVEVENKNILNYLLLSLEHVLVIDEMTNEDRVDTARE
jgi:hypothetical protein